MDGLRYETFRPAICPLLAVNSTGSSLNVARAGPSTSSRAFSISCRTRTRSHEADWKRNIPNSGFSARRKRTETSREDNIEILTETSSVSIIIDNSDGENPAITSKMVLWRSEEHTSELQSRF